MDFPEFPQEAPRKAPEVSEQDAHSRMPLGAYSHTRYTEETNQDVAELRRQLKQLRLLLAGALVVIAVLEIWRAVH